MRPPIPTHNRFAVFAASRAAADDAATVVKKTKPKKPKDDFELPPEYQDSYYPTETKQGFNKEGVQWVKNIHTYLNQFMLGCVLKLQPETTRALIGRLDKTLSVLRRAATDFNSARLAGDEKPFFLGLPRKEVGELITLAESVKKDVEACATQLAKDEAVKQFASAEEFPELVAGSKKVGKPQAVPPAWGPKR